jgi:hypothetical protein
MILYLSLTCLILCVGRSYTDPLLDEEDTESDTPLPNRMVTQRDDTHTLRQINGSSSIVDWYEQNVGDTHIGTRLKAGPRKEKGKKAKVTDEALLASDESTPSPDEGWSPPYQESNLSTSTSSDDDDDDGDGDSGGYRIKPSQPPIQFTG